MKPVLRVIIIEDSPDDALLMVREVERAGYTVKMQRVETAEALRDALAQGTWDLVLADYSLPEFSATEGLAILWQTGLDVPFIIVSGCIGEEAAVQLMRDGAADCVMKDHLSLLGPDVQRELYDADERKRKRDVEGSLADSEKRYRLLVENQTDLIVKTDPEGRILYASPTYLALFGKSSLELKSLSCQPLIHPDDLPSVELTVADLFHPSHVCRYEERAMTVDGWRWIEWNTRAELDSKGTVVALAGSGRDITERKQMEDELRVALLQWNQFLEACPDAMWIKDVSGRYVAANKAYHQVDPCVYGNVVGKTDAECFPPEQAEAYAADDRVAFETGVSEGEFTAVGLDGQLRSFQTKKVVLYASDGSVAGTLGVSRDVTVRKQIEYKLRTSEADLLQAQAVAHVGSWRWDITHDKLVWSDEMYRIFGIAPQEFTGSFQDVIARAIHPDDRRNVEESNRSVIEDHKPRPIEYRIVWSDHSVHTVWAEAGEMTLDEHGNAASLTGVILDITERKKAEAEKERLREQLVQSQKLEAMGQLAGGVAHDFNNLLTGILGNVAIIRRDLPASDPLVANLLAVEAAARQAADLAKGLLTFSHKVAVTAVPLNMAETVDTALGILKHSLPATMKIVLDIEQPSWNVLADLSQITQVILNLAVNARDAMQGNGTLTIRLRNEEVGEEYVRTHSFARTGEFVHLSVADTGPGIPPGIRKHLFEPFYTTKPPGSGTGLGLSSVYGAITQADGWVTADSPGGGGAIFDIFLPRCLDKPSTHTTPSDISANVCSGTVLVAEDEPVVRAVAQALLTRSGCSVLTAEDGASALRALREHQGTIDLILLDMTMPGMTTQEIVPALRALSPSVPVLLTSGYVSGEEVRCFLEEGTVQGFLPKPYEVHELLDSVRHLLERS